MTKHSALHPPPNDALAVGKVGVSSPALPPMPKPPPNSSLPLWGKSRAGFARFATDAKATAERRSRRGKGQGGIRPLCRRCQNDRRTAPSPCGGRPGWGSPALPPMPKPPPNSSLPLWEKIGVSSPALPPMPKPPPNSSLPRGGGAGWGSPALPPMPKRPPNGSLPRRGGLGWGSKPSASATANIPLPCRARSARSGGGSGRG